MIRSTLCISGLLAFLLISTWTPALAQDCFIGEVRWFAGNFAPRGWAKMEGQLLAVSPNSTLFSILGPTYGGDGRTTFGIPDLRGRVLVGSGTGSGLSPRQLGEKNGKEKHRLTINEMPRHSHAAIGSLARANQVSPQRGLPAITGRNPSYFKDRTKVTTMSGQSNAPTGGTAPHENMQPYFVLTPIICMEGLYPARN